MKSVSIALMATLAAVPMSAPAQRDPVRAAAPSAPSRGLNVHSAVPTAPVGGVNEPSVHNQPALNTAAILNKNVGTATQYHPVTSAPTSNSNISGTNAHHYLGVIVNPVLNMPAWGWNHGVVWMPQGTYWGGTFWGPFGPGAATTAEIMGSIIHGNDQVALSYGVSPGSPGAKLLSNYGLRQVRCGTPGLVVIYGPNLGVVCAYPTYRVGAGNYAVNINTLTLQSR